MEPLAERVADGIADGSRARSLRGLAGAEGRLARLVDHMHLDAVRHAGEAHDRIARPVDACNVGLSKVTASYSVQLMACRMPPSVWFLMPSGLTAWPLSMAATARTTRVRPVSRSISTSTATAR